MTTKQREFINKIAPFAVAGAKKYGFPFPSICIAQAIHESGWGSSTLAINNLNFFGIKLNHAGISDLYTIGNAVEEVNGKDVTFSGEKWAKFHSVEDGVNGYYRYLTVWQHYAPAFKMRTREECMRHIGKTYATRTGYADKILKIIKDYDLTIYDNHYTLDWTKVKKGDKVVTAQDYKVALSESKAKKAQYAKNVDGSVKVYPKGEYYIYKVSGDCVNISKTKLLPGGWIYP